MEKVEAVDDGPGESPGQRVSVGLAAGSQRDDRRTLRVAVNPGAVTGLSPEHIRRLERGQEGAYQDVGLPGLTHGWGWRK